MTFDGTCERGGVGGSNEHPRKLRRSPLLPAGAASSRDSFSVPFYIYMGYKMACRWCLLSALGTQAQAQRCGSWLMALATREREQVARPRPRPAPASGAIPFYRRYLCRIEATQKRRQTPRRCAVKCGPRSSDYRIHADFVSACFGV
jgi:hypothetical protein